ncbi:MAG TPA: hypothetical protein PKI01_08495 [Bacteroidales bacterium]|nr:hypothetical protein [Bacteroidales bacterium]
MTKSLKKKLWFIIIGFIVLMAPIGYFAKNSLAIDMQNRAMLNATQISPDDANVIKESIVQIDKAIWLYRHDYLFYANKATLLCQLKKYHEAVITIDQIFKFKPDYAEGYEIQGFIYDKLGLTDSANYCYKQAIDAHEKRILKYSSDQEKVKFAKISIAIDRWLLFGQEYGKKELIELRISYSGDMAVVMFDSTLRNFDRASYVNRMIK